MTDQSPTPPSVIDAQIDAVLTAYDYALKRYKLEASANWRAPVRLELLITPQAEAATVRCAESLVALEAQK